MKQLFTEICDYKEIVDYVPSQDGKNNVAVRVMMSHYPILFWNGQHRKAVHLYGHLHKSHEETMFRQALNMVNAHFQNETDNGKNDCPQAKAFNVFYEFNDSFKPITLKELLERE